MEPSHVVTLVIFVLIAIGFIISKVSKASAAAPQPPPQRRGPRPRPAPKAVDGSRPQRAATATSRSALAPVLAAWAKGSLTDLPEDLVLQSPDEAERVAKTLVDRLAEAGGVSEAQTAAMLSLLTRVQDMDTLMAVDEVVVPHIVPLAKRTQEDPDTKDIAPILLRVARVFAAMGTPRAGMTVILMTQMKDFAEHWMWSQVFANVPLQGPGARPFAGGLVKRLPEGFCAVAILDFCNALLHAEENPGPHPFDTPEGIRRLADWLGDSDHPSYGESASVALAFLSVESRERLLPLALAHGSAHVRLETAYAAARHGDPRGIAGLVQACSTPAWAKRAGSFLMELGASDQIPDVALDPDFQAQAEVCEWTRHPNEMQREPDLLHVRYRRELYWPPQDRRIEVVLVAYAYKNLFDRGPTTGVALVGPVTFALIGISLTDLDDAEILGHYCVWELNQRGDRRAPATDDVGEGDCGRHILASYNPDAGFLRPGELLRPEWDFAKAASR